MPVLAHLILFYYRILIHQLNIKTPHSIPINQQNIILLSFILYSLFRIPRVKHALIVVIHIHSTCTYQLSLPPALYEGRITRRRFVLEVKVSNQMVYLPMNKTNTLQWFPYEQTKLCLLESI